MRLWRNTAATGPSRSPTTAPSAVMGYRWSTGWPRCRHWGLGRARSAIPAGIYRLTRTFWGRELAQSVGILVRETAVLAITFALFLRFLQVMGLADALRTGGPGRGRTADLPLFSSTAVVHVQRV